MSALPRAIHSFGWRRRIVLVGRSARATTSPSGRATAGCGLAGVVAAAMTVSGCDVNSALERLSEARQLSADMLVQFTKAADGANL